MARLTRKNNKLFCGNAQQSDVGQFGSLNAGTKVETTDINTIQSLSAWGDGWKAATLGDNCYPTRQERNGLDYVQSYLLNYLYQEGIPEWSANTTYYKGSIIKLINGTDIQLYKSLKNNNTAALSDSTAWEKWNYANLDLSNLSATGEKHFLNYSQMTNCLIETPQNLFWEEIGNGIRLKAGSKITIPNGFETDGTTLKFDTITITEDLDSVYTGGNTINTFLVYRTDTGVLTRTILSDAVSGTTAPSGTGMWYDTTTNTIKFYSSGTLSFGTSLPLGVFNLGTKKLIQSFNHMGFIGSAMFTLGGIKMLVADGRNSDGTLKNVTLSLGQPNITVLPVSSSTTFPNQEYYYRLRYKEGGNIESYNRIRSTRVHHASSFNNLPVITELSLNLCYVDDTSTWYYYYGTDNILQWTPVNLTVIPNALAKFDSTGMYFESMTIPETVSLLNSDLSNLSAIGETHFAKIKENYKNGNSWYRIWSDGWKEQGGVVTLKGSTDTGSVSLLKNFADTNYTVLTNALSTTPLSYQTLIQNKATSGFDAVISNLSVDTNVMWYACGY